MSASRFAAWLRSNVEAKGWRQLDLAEEVGVSQQTASRWLLAQTLPNVRHAQALAHAFDVPIEEVVEHLGTPAFTGGSEDPRETELEELRARVRDLEAELDRRSEG